MSNVQLDFPYNTDDNKSSTEEYAPQLPNDQFVVRPPIDYSSINAFFHSTWQRFLSLWTRRFVLSLLAGQLVSLCITCTNVTTQELTSRNWQLPTTQTFFLYFTLFVIYTPYTIYQYGFKGWFKLLFKDGWKYIILATCDVEGNFLVVKAYDFTNLLSCMLLDAWATPVCMFFLYVYFRKRFHWTQYLGVLICIAGLGLLVTADQLTNKDWQAINKGKGDAFMILGATLYGFTNATEELFVRQSPLYEVVGQLGMWGVIINGVQATLIERHKWKTSTWSGRNIGLLVAYTAAMFILYTVAPLLYRMASSVYFNIALLTSDFYGLLFGLFLFHFTPYWLYFPSFTVVLLGLVVYFWHTTPEEQGTVNIRTPNYVKRRGEAVAEVSEQQKGDV